MKIIMYILLWLTLSCSFKRKLVDKNTNEVHKETSMQTVQLKKQTNQNYKLNLDSFNNRNWFKIYPKDIFVLDNNGFQGSADSLIWYGDSQKFSKQLQSARQDQNALNSTALNNTETQITKEQKVNLVKIRWSLWWLVPILIISSIIYIYYQRTRFNT